MKSDGYRAVVGFDARFILRPLRGMPNYALKLCERLPAARPQYRFVYFINRGFEHNAPEAEYAPRLERLQSLPNVRIVNHDHDAEGTWEQWHLPRLARQAGVDMLHLPGNRLPFFAPVPVVATIHDVTEIRQLDRLVPLPGWRQPRLQLYFLRQHLYVRAIYKLGIRRADHLITPSQDAARDVHDLTGVPADRITVIHHGLDEDFDIRPEEVAPFENRRHVLMLGGDSYQKNPEGAIAAWARVPEPLRRRFPLRIVGFVGDESSTIRQSLRREGLEDEVTLRGWIDKAELLESFRTAAAFLFVSRHEGFGFPLIQSMASGTPVIWGRASSLPEVAGPAGLGFLPDDHSAIAKGLESLLGDSRVWQAQVDAGLARAAEFSWDRSTEAHARAYDSVLDANP